MTAIYKTGRRKKQSSVRALATMVTCRRAAPTQNIHSVSETAEFSTQVQDRYDLRPTGPVKYGEDSTDDITSNDYPSESASEGVGRRMSSTSNSTYDSEWTTDDDESGYGHDSFVASDSGESIDSNSSFAPSDLTGDYSSSDGFSEINVDSPHSPSVAGSDYWASVLPEKDPIPGNGERESSADPSSCDDFYIVSDDPGNGISDDSSDEDLDCEFPVHRLK